MAPPLTTSIIIEIVLIPIFAVLAGVTIYNFIRLRSVKLSFGFCSPLRLVTRSVGNICTVVAWFDSYEQTDLLTRACILTILSYALLFSSVLCLYNSTRTHHTVFARVGKGLHGVTTIASVLVIIGVLNSRELFVVPADADSSAELSKIAHIGTVLYIVITAVLAVLILLAKLGHSYVFSIDERADEEEWREQQAWTPLALNTTVLALPLLVARLVYTCCLIFGSDNTLLLLSSSDVWPARLVGAGIVEVGLLVILNGAGFRLAKYLRASCSSSSSSFSKSSSKREIEYGVVEVGRSGSGVVEQQ
ncbi:hypothetical protein OC844_003363 [Tilletia horrida]|nr:hypothetical protein OC844_003363 [Tilletia horrida]